MSTAADDSRAWAYLSRVAEPPCAELAALVRSVGPVEAAERVRRGLVDGELARHTESRREIDRAADDLELLARRGGRLITPDSDEWPALAFAAFAALEGGFGGRAKLAAGRRWCCGRWARRAWTKRAMRAVALVGTRAATAYGEHVAADLAAGVAERDVAVVSGGAYGIDGAAHRAALDGRGSHRRGAGRRARHPLSGRAFGAAASHRAARAAVHRVPAGCAPGPATGS